MVYSTKERRALLALARASIAHALGESAPEPPSLEEARANERRGVFVTLRKGGELRGCIGFVDARFALQEAVREVAVKAATEDPRFPPLTRPELDEVELEISVLSALVPARSVEDVIVGTHGVMVDAGYARGLLLPHVATEYGWTREVFMNHACLKAGLPAQAWRESGLKIYTFTTETFSDKDFAPHREHAGS